MKSINRETLSHLVYVNTAPFESVVDLRCSTIHSSRDIPESILSFLRSDCCEHLVADEEAAKWLSENNVICDPEKNDFSAPSSSVPMLRLIVSNSCNFSCPYCHVFKESTHYNTKKINLMSAKLAIECVSRFQSYLNKINAKKPIISFYGGESLLNQKAIIDVCQHFRKSSYNYIINTNGSPINELLLSKIPREFVDFHISLDGASEQHNQTRYFNSGKGSFKKISENIQLLQKGGFSLQVNFMVTVRNLNNLGDFLETLRTLSVSRLYFDIAKEVYCTVNATELAMILIKFFAGCSRYHIKTSGPWRLIFFTINNILNAPPADVFKWKVPRLRPPEMNLEVHPNGKVYSSHYVSDKHIGEYTDLDNVKLMDFYDLAVQNAGNLLKECNGCSFRFSCAGSIRYVWKYHYETTNGAELACNVFRMIGLSTLKSGIKKNTK